MSTESKSTAGVEALAEYQRKIKAGEIEKPAQKNPMEKAQEDPKSKAKAIIAKCYDCIYDPADKGSWRQQVRECSCTTCPLWTVRPQ